ncbi:SDR family oxidoreductase [Helicobacter enhydrae]|uniref:SDR family oxidoreductase n=1 Tax=Helicobacter enhydrae TaxID=222136 RepID=UPI001F45280A|nr:SDR family oxidoreductase [Helicobacter enhydrae]
MVLITGASSDLGLALIDALDSQTMILAHYHSHNVFNDLKFKNKNIMPIQCDLSNKAQVLRMIKDIDSIALPNKIVHFAAPKIHNRHFKNLTWEDYCNHIKISLESIFYILNYFLPKLVKDKNTIDKKVVFVLSSCTKGIPPATLSDYVTTKYALLGFLKSLASEYREKNIQFNAVSPSMIETKFLENLNEKIIELNANRHPLKRNATPNDVIPAILFLLSKSANFINGENFTLSGGEVF